MPPQGGGRLRSKTAEWRRAFRLRLVACQVLVGLLPAYSLSTLRAGLYRSVAGFDFAPSVAVHGKIQVMGFGAGFRRRFQVGEGSVLGFSLRVFLDSEVRIGRNVSFSPDVTIVTSSHLFGPASRRMNPDYYSRPVVVEDGAWICYGATLMPGVTIGRGAVVGAHSVVQQDVAPNTFVVGSPARLVCELPDEGPAAEYSSVPATEVTAIVRRCVSEVFGIPDEELTDDTSPALDHRWSSLKHARLMDQIAAATGIRLGEGEYNAAQTLGSTVRAYQRAAGRLEGPGR